MTTALPQRLFRQLVGAGLCFFSGCALAQTTPGQLLQDIRQLQPGKPPEVQGPSGLELPSGQEEKRPTTEVEFVVQNFLLEGNHQLASSELQPLLAHLVGRRITYGDLVRGTDAIADRYRQSGWLVRVVLPPQDITDGHVMVRVVEARLSDIRVDNRSRRYSTEVLQNWIYGQLPRGSALNLVQLEHALLTLGDLPDLVAQGSLQEGLQPGETLLLLHVGDEDMFSAQVSLDSFGDKNTGKERLSTQLTFSGVTLPGDQWSVYGLHTEGSDYARVGWMAPSHRDNRGQRWGFYASSMNYRIVNAEFGAARIRGGSDVVGAEATDPLIRSRSVNLLASFNASLTQFKGSSNGVATVERNYKSVVTQWGVSGNRFDEWQGAGVNNLSLIASLGHVDRRDADLLQEGGVFAKLRYAVSRTQTLTPSLSLHMGVSGQLASHNMDSSEQLYLGGPLNVRAYTSGQGAASEGQLYSLELRQQLTPQWQLTYFYDEARVTRFKFPAADQADNRHTLSGAGASVAWTAPAGVHVKATWARRTGALSASLANTLAQQGGLSRDRFWLAATVPF